MPIDSSDFADHAEGLREAAADNRPHEKTLYYSIQRDCAASLRANPSWLPLALSALAAFAGQIGLQLEDDAVELSELPYWIERALQTAAILDAVADQNEERALKLISEASSGPKSRQLH